MLKLALSYSASAPAIQMKVCSIDEEFCLNKVITATNCARMIARGLSSAKSLPAMLFVRFPDIEVLAMLLICNSSNYCLKFI